MQALPQVHEPCADLPLEVGLRYLVLRAGGSLSVSRNGTRLQTITD
jgi:hypothetical protein